MKRFFLPTILLFGLLFGFSQRTNAQDKRLDSSPKNFRTFFSKFIKAVEKNDRTIVVSMTKFPFQYGFDAGSEGAMTKNQFTKRYTEIFGKTPKKFMTEKNPLFSKGEGNTYIISTEDASHLTFAKHGKTFRFVSYIVEP